MGLLPDQLPGYVPVDDAQARAALAELWGTSVPADAGLDYDAMLDGGVHALYVMGADPARHATPEQLARLESMEFLVVQDLFLTETAQRATVVLPAVAYTEKDGTFTNTERCVQVVRRAMTELPGARADWDILSSVAAHWDSTGITARRSKSWRRSHVPTDSMPASRARGLERREHAGRWRQRAPTRMDMCDWARVRISPGRC